MGCFLARAAWGERLGWSSMKRILHILTGCTAVGKTEWALRWAEANNGEIISCDSLLFYRGLDIGTAKPRRAELARVPHHLIGVCAVTERMDVTYYVTKVRAALAEIEARGKAVLVAGGSGFYLKAFFSPVADDVAVSAELRSEVASLPADEALRRLRALNPAGLGTLATDNPRRVTRALERCLASGKTVVELAENFSRQPSPFSDWEVNLTEIQRGPEELARRIDARVVAMLRDGLIEEVRRLRAQGLEQNPSAARAIGYREVLALLDGKLAQEDLAAEIAKNTRGLVKKQRTWFRTQLPPHRVVEAAGLRDVAELF